MEGAADALLEDIPALEYCSVATGARLLGDRWTLMVVRELLSGTHRFNDLHRAMPTLSRSMLAGRLRNLERAGVVLRAPVAGSVRHEYHLTAAGEALRAVLASIGDWTSTWHLASPTPVAVPALLLGLQRSLRPASLPRPKVCIEFQFAGGSHSRGWLHVEPRHVRACVDNEEADVDLVVRTRPEVLDDLWHGRRDCTPTIEAGDIAFAGPRHLAEGFRDWFRHADDPSA